MYSNRYRIYLVVMVTAVFVASCRAAHVHIKRNYIFKFESLTCWTCLNKTNNDRCNDWAPNVPCYSEKHTMCQTLHLVDTKTGNSLAVTKRCAKPQQCMEAHIGCHQTDIPGVKECVTCCNKDYCNEHVPANHTSAIQLSYLPSAAPSSGLSLYLITFIFLCLTKHWVDNF